MNKTFVRLLMALTTLLVLGNSAQAQNDQPVPYQEGVHYFLIEGAPAAPVETQELSEVFSYLCTHCNTFEPYVSSWKQNKPEGVVFQKSARRFWPGVLGTVCAWIRDRRNDECA